MSPTPSGPLLAPPRDPRGLFRLLAERDPAGEPLAAILENVDFSGLGPSQVHHSIFGHPPATSAVSQYRSAAAYDPKADFIATLVAPEFRDKAIELFLHAFPEKRRLLFVHIPKCAGTDLRANLVPRFLALSHLLASKAWMPDEAFLAELAAAARSIDAVDDILVHGHLHLSWYLNRVGARLGDRIFTIIRDPVELALSQANYAVSVVVRDPARQHPDTRENLDRLGLKQLPENPSPEMLKQLALRAFLDPRLTAPNVICTYLAGFGKGCADALANLIAYDVEVTDTARYNAWLDQAWGVHSTTRHNSSIKFLLPADVEPHRGHLDALTSEDRKLYDVVVRALSQAGTPSIRGTELSAMQGLPATARPPAGGEEDPVERCIGAARRGDREAQFRLGVMYCTGEGVPQNVMSGALWYRRAAEQGHAYAQYNIAVMVLHGQGIRPDPRAAFEWARKAAEQGVVQAQTMLGDLYAAGSGTAADPAAARRWHETAAGQGRPAAAAKLEIASARVAASPLREETDDLPRRTGSARPGTIAIITMVYNERVNLPIWLRHYRRTAPTAALFVIDHASDDGSTDNLAGVNKIPIPRETLDEIDRTYLINSLQQGLLRYYDTVIYTDCDELIVANPTKSGSLEAHLQSEGYPYAAPIGLHIVHIVDREPPIDFTQPLLRQRRYAHFHSRACKPAITRVPLHWSPGFHTCERQPNIDKDLFLFHIKQIDKDEALRRQHFRQNLSWSRRAIDFRHSAHHRYADERFIRELFLEPADQLRRFGARGFSFEHEIARVQEEAHAVSGMFAIPEFKGPLVEIPEYLRDAF